MVYLRWSWEQPCHRDASTQSVYPSNEGIVDTLVSSNTGNIRKVKKTRPCFGFLKLANIRADTKVSVIPTCNRVLR
jgi:hypothetical protein